MIFLTFLKPIINDRGFDFKEVHISEERRLDVAVTYNNRKFVIEIKRWKVPKVHRDGLTQLVGHLEVMKMKNGYLIIFDFNRKRKEWKQETCRIKGKEIFQVWV